jgi:hypothetical protein
MWADLVALGSSLQVLLLDGVGCEGRSLDGMARLRGLDLDTVGGLPHLRAPLLASLHDLKLAGSLGGSDVAALRSLELFGHCGDCMDVVHYGDVWQLSSLRGSLTRLSLDCMGAQMEGMGLAMVRHLTCLQVLAGWVIGRLAEQVSVRQSDSQSVSQSGRLAE